tara:strand:- start:1794 stop:2141 length:348 start_codon:yes stop_codon:yes gene_type:complete
MQAWLPKHEHNKKYILQEPLVLKGDQLQSHTFARYRKHHNQQAYDLDQEIIIPAGSVFTWRAQGSRWECKLVLEFEHMGTPETEYLLYTLAGKKRTANVDLSLSGGMKFVARPVE